MEQSILNIKFSEKIPIHNILKKTKCKDIIYIIKKLKFKFAGHIIRHSTGKWYKRLVERTQYNYKRKKGRPNCRWEGELIKRAGILWTRTAKYRKVWKKTGEAYAQQWAI